LRAYNRLARLSRGAFIVFLQDDSLPPLPDGELTWLAHAASLFEKYVDVGVIGLSQALFFVSGYDESKVGVQCLDDLPDRMPVCRTPLAGWRAADGNEAFDPRRFPGMIGQEIRVEAIRCADLGPVLVRTSIFLASGGFNESGTRRGEPGSVNVDCELQARLWLRGHATVYLGLDGKQRWEHSEERRAWRHPRMAQGHVQRRHWYWQRFERPGSPERLTIEHAARAINDRFDCPRAHLSSQPRSKFDCYVTAAPGTCEV